MITAVTFIMWPCPIRDYGEAREPEDDRVVSKRVWKPSRENTDAIQV